MHSVRREVEPDPLTTRRGDDVFYLDEKIGAYRGRLYGLAVDIGTTTVVMNLVDLESGECFTRHHSRIRSGSAAAT